MAAASPSSNADGGPEGSRSEYSLEFVAVGANRQANCSSWGRNGLVAYSASKFVGIYDPLVCIAPVNQIHIILFVESSVVTSFQLTDFVFQFKEQQLLGTLPGHTERVTASKWIPNVGMFGL